MVHHSLSTNLIQIVKLHFSIQSPTQRNDLVRNSSHYQQATHQKELFNFFLCFVWIIKTNKNENMYLCNVVTKEGGKTFFNNIVEYAFL